MNQETNAEHILRIKKVLALAQSSNENEARAAAELAERLMQRYEVTQEDLDRSTDDGFSQYLIIETPTYLAYHEMQLAVVVAEFNDCVVVFKEHPKPERALAVGSKEQAEKTKDQFLWLHGELGRAAQISSRKRARVFSLYWKRSFWLGAVDSLDERFTRIRKAEAEPEEEEKETFGFWRNLINKVRGRNQPQPNKLVKAEEDQFSKVENHVKDLGVDYKDVDGEDTRQILDSEAYQMGFLLGQKIELSAEERRRELKASEENTHEDSGRPSNREHEEASGSHWLRDRRSC